MQRFGADIHTYMLGAGKEAKQKTSENRDLKMVWRRKAGNQGSLHSECVMKKRHVCKMLSKCLIRILAKQETFGKRKSYKSP